MTYSSARNQTPSVLPEGSVIAQRYRIDSVLAEGGMGIVYRGWHLNLEQPIAIKVIRPEYVGNAEATARFLNEARAVATLRAVNVAQVLDVGRINGGTLYMVLEYLEGRDLRSVLQQEGALPVARAISFIAQACAAMHDAHAVGIVHRDLKPENLFAATLSDGRELLKVIDFGISKRLASHDGRSFTEAGRSLGSPHYMAPEQIASPDSVDARADIWSLGVVLFELLSNVLPFDGSSPATTCAKVLCGEPRSLSELRADLSPDLLSIVDRCLKKDPAERFASAAELAEDLEALGYSETPRGSGLRIRPLVARRAEYATDLDIEVQFDLTSDTDLAPAPTPKPRSARQAFGRSMAALAAVGAIGLGLALSQPRVAQTVHVSEAGKHVIESARINVTLAVNSISTRARAWWRDRVSPAPAPAASGRGVPSAQADDRDLESDASPEPGSTRSPLALTNVRLPPRR